ncbi:efflux or type I secretion ABC-type transporter, membrane fusion component, HlyD family [Psychroflexus torquis ATCC 700755]|uniref:Efflux or type I secretion ABC-type transporter, membrane fusion component, HlyD family n=1 Tax=Psychroflexus torquis (strain ATCC 700755 / CIP 106069 / ACAM 623) TaxID=313595 RepID=K4IEN7_PSYTT|nr:HlyD family efflux transporter periplasmic adaptor subunit [Psychroflexus torquis]AFU68992.1 efflux or type I secretion ABC-type transporter, membrane fusion component, HlyD family [Psychroflexus torquis ATCC 700755]
MLDVSKEKLNEKVDLSHYKSMLFTFNKDRFLTFNKIMSIFGIVFLVVLFLPWTQNVQGNGFVTTLEPNQRPQSIESAISGRVEEWYVSEGQIVNKGDTILHISEVTDKFFDPNLLMRTESQITAKNFSLESYTSKVNALNFQIEALKEERKLKLEQSLNTLEQARLQVQTDSIDLEAVKIQLSIAGRQFERTETLENEGLKAITDVESKKLQLQNSQAKVISQKNKLLSSKNQEINSKIEISSIKANYQEKISKAESDKFTALSGQYDTEAQMTKLKNEFTNYKVRSGMLFITAPQDGFINRAIQKGIGETFSAGTKIISIMPINIEMAVETFVRPIDLPLLHPGENVRIIFDGWPAIFFSGWPNLSYGTYGGEVVAVERTISDNGKFRVLIKPNPDEQEWPEVIRAGSGARTIALLNNVSIWYEMWRQINGFPPDYYQPQESNKNSNKNQNAGK